MAKKKAKKFEEREITVEDFAQIVGVTKRTVREYCLRIQAGQEHVLKNLKERYGLVSVKRISNRWSLVVQGVIVT